MTTPVDVSIIIVSFNTKGLTTKCLTSLAQSKTPNDRWEVIIVDNASTDGSTEIIKNLELRIKNLKIIQNAKNMGFAKANNQGIWEAKGKYVLLLNSDTEVPKETIQTMLAFMEKHPDAGAVTCKVFLPDESMDPACHRGFPTPWAAFTYFLGLERLFPASQFFGQYHLGYKDINSVHEIDSPSGAFFLIRREVIDQVGLLDEDYFMYGEDLDWAYRIKQAGWKILFNPDVSILHRKKQSGRANEDSDIRRRTEKHFDETMQLFYRKHFAQKYGWLTTQLVLLGIKLRSLI